MSLHRSARLPASTLEIMRIAVIGLGALGSIYSERILRGAPDTDLVVVADGERADRLERDGIVVNGERQLWPVVRPGDGTGPADLLIIATKAGALDQAIVLARPHTGGETTVLSLINGIHSEPLIHQALPHAHVIASMTAGSDVVRVGGDVRFTNFGGIAFGPTTDVPADTDRVTALDAFLTAADVPHEVPADMTHRLWWKFMGNIGINPASAMLDAPYGAFQSEGAPARAVMLAAQAELIRIANARGIPLGQPDLDEWLRVIGTLDPAGQTSMLQDMRAARPTEIDIFSGEVVRLGLELGIPTPVNAVLRDGVRARELLVAD